MIVADAQGAAADFEATGPRLSRQYLDPGEVYWHTNHCRQSDEPCGFESSLVRGRRWAELVGAPGPVSPERLQGWLADRADGANSICQVADPALAGAATWLQTLASVVLDLGERTMRLSDGPSCLNPFQTFRL
jgi:hypothetical protein